MHIFISYAKKDTRGLAIKLRDILAETSGISVWMDESLEPTRSWTQQIEAEIKRCQYMVVLLSPDVNRQETSQQKRSFVLKEIAYAQDTANKPIITVLAQKTDIPLRLSDDQLFDFTRDLEAELLQLVKYVCERVSVDAPPILSNYENHFVKWKRSVADLYYIDLRRLTTLESVYNQNVDISFLQGIHSIHSLDIREYAMLLKEVNKILKHLDLNVIPFNRLNLTDVSLEGNFVDFQALFRTKNIKSLEYYPQEYVPSANIKKDPHVYIDANNWITFLYLNPRWFTTDTAITNFKPAGGWNRFAGLFKIKKVNMRSKEIIGDPILIGLPKPLNNFLFDEF